jgi:hypothetical protein
VTNTISKDCFGLEEISRLNIETYSENENPAYLGQDVKTVQCTGIVSSMLFLGAVESSHCQMLNEFWEFVAKEQMKQQQTGNNRLNKDSL